MDKRSKIAILGFGVEGRAIFDYLLEHGYFNLTVCDQNVDLDFEMPDGVSTRLGENYLNDLEDFDVVFRSPGISCLRPEIKLAKQNGVEVTSGTAFFMDQCPCPAIGVTGTKGKGTTCTLIYEILKKSGRKAGVDLFLGGNIGKSPMKFLDKLKGDHLVILELSSFQLQDLEKSPHYGVLLNTTIDHLDYHADTEEYWQAKASLLTNQHKQCFAVLNQDYPYFDHYKPLIKGELALVSTKNEPDFGAFVKWDDARKKEGKIFYKGKKSEKNGKGKSSKDSDSKNSELEEILKVSEVAMVGSHNLENILPAIVITKELGVKNADIAETIKEFKNLPHRLQFVRELNGVKYFNDSYSTNTQTSMAAVDSFEEPTILIAGGYDKGLDYNDWALKILTKQNLHTVILVGDTSDKMERALFEAEEKLGEAEGSPTKIIRRMNLEDAVVDSYAEAEEGSVVVMSPAASSFDLYKSYKDRGNEFVAQVRKLK